MTPKLIIFDCDGVLVDSEPVTTRIIAANLARYGLDIPATDVEALFVGGTLKGVGETARDMGAPLPDNWLDEIYAETFAALRGGVPVFEGLYALLDAIDSLGIATAIASNGPMEKMEITLPPVNLHDRFSGRIYSGHVHGAPKPAPDLLLHAMACATVTRADTVMIDDSAAGCGAAQAAGVRCFGFLPEGDTEKLAAKGATPVRSMTALQHALGL